MSLRIQSPTPFVDAELEHPVGEAIVAYLLKHQRRIPRTPSGKLTFSFGSGFLSCSATIAHGPDTSLAPVIIPLPNGRLR